MANVAFSTTIARADGTTATSLAANLTTAASNIVLAVITTVSFGVSPAFRTVTGVSGGTGLTWARRSQNTFNATVGPYFMCVEVWWAFASAAQSARPITATFSGAPSRSHIHLIEFSGVTDTANPFTSSTPAVATRNNGTTGAVPSISMNVTRAAGASACAPFAAMMCMNVGVAVTAGGSSTMRSTISNADEISSVEGFTTTGITTANLSFTGSQNFFLMVADLITPEAAGVNGNASGSVLTATTSVISGAATGGASGAGSVLTATDSVASGSATTSVTTDVNMIPVFPSIIAGSAAGNSSASGATLTATESIAAGAAAGGASASGATTTVTESVTSGSAAGGASSAGDTLGPAVQLIDGAATTDGSYIGDTFGPTVELVAGSALVIPESPNGDAAGATLQVDTAIIAGVATGDADDQTQRIAGVGVGYRRGPEPRHGFAFGDIIECRVALVDGVAAGTESSGPARDKAGNSASASRHEERAASRSVLEPVEPDVVASPSIAGSDLEARHELAPGRASADNSMLYDLLLMVA